MNAGWIIPFIIMGGALQTCGAAMNGQLNKHLVNPWLASAISFAMITFFFAGAFFIMPHPLPTTRDIASMPWWAVIGGLVGAVQVYAGLTLVNKVGAGPFMGITVTSALIMSLVVDHFGWFRMDPHPSTPGGLSADYCSSAVSRSSPGSRFDGREDCRVHPFTALTARWSGSLAGPEVTAARPIIHPWSMRVCQADGRLARSQPSAGAAWAGNEGDTRPHPGADLAPDPPKDLIVHRQKIHVDSGLLRILSIGYNAFTCRANSGLRPDG